MSDMYGRMDVMGRIGGMGWCIGMGATVGCRTYFRKSEVVIEMWVGFSK